MADNPRKDKVDDTDDTIDPSADPNHRPGRDTSPDDMDLYLEEDEESSKQSAASDKDILPEDMEQYKEIGKGGKRKDQKIKRQK